MRLLIPAIAIILCIHSVAEEEDKVYHSMALLLISECIDDKNANLIEEINKHGADMVANSTTSCVSQTFYLFILRDEFNEQNKFNKAYKLQIGRLIAKVGKDNVEKIIRRGFAMDGIKDDRLRIGIAFFGDKKPTLESLEKSLGNYLALEKIPND
jgi:hypothetical protein